MGSFTSLSYHPLLAPYNPHIPSEEEVWKKIFDVEQNNSRVIPPKRRFFGDCDYSLITSRKIDLIYGKEVDIFSCYSIADYYRVILDHVSQKKLLECNKLYNRLSYEDRIAIYYYIRQGLSLTDIGLLLNRDKSAISREIDLGYSKGTDVAVKRKLYTYVNAQLYHMGQATRRGWKGKLNTDLISTICKNIKSSKKLSPEQIANTELKGLLSTQTIYNWIHAKRVFDITMKDLRHKGKHKRHNKSKLTKYQDIPNIKYRPLIVNDRLEFGHWELDSVVSSRRGHGCIFTFVERKTRFLIAVQSDSCDSNCLNRALREKINQYPEGTFKTITSDKGSEFSGLLEIQGFKGVKVYMTDPHAPWQKGTNENTNGLIREYYPKGTDFSKVSQRELRYNCIDPLMGRPRRVLDWQTPREAFQMEVEMLKSGKKNEVISA